MSDNDIIAAVVLQLGPVAITTTVLTTWVLMFALALFAWISTARLGPQPGPLQTAL